MFLIDEAQRVKAILEYDQIVRPRHGNRLRAEAKETLNYWSNWSRTRYDLGHKSWLGRLVNDNNKANKIYNNVRGLFYMRDDQMTEVDKIVSSLCREHRLMINYQYIKKWTIQQKLEKTGLAKSTYYDRLADAHDEFIAKGGLDV